MSTPYKIVLSIFQFEGVEKKNALRGHSCLILEIYFIYPIFSYLCMLHDSIILSFECFFMPF